MTANWSSQLLVDTWWATPVRRLELIRADATQIAVAACRIVKVLNVLGYVQDGAHSVGVEALFDTLFLQATEEGFRNGIVPAVSASAHARFEMVRLAEAPPGVASVLRSLV